MALADYRLCDRCGDKAFYDANLSYEGARERIDPDAFRVAGQDQGWGAILWRQGDWSVLCRECAKTHRTAILPIESAPQDPSTGGA